MKHQFKFGSRSLGAVSTAWADSSILLFEAGVARAVLLMRLSSVPSSILNARTAIVAHQPAENKIECLKLEFKTALLNVALNRKKIYDIILDLKEHFHEYGFKSPAAAVENICQRSKRWANQFVSEIEAEVEVYGKIQGGQNPSTLADETKSHKEDTLNKVADLPIPETGIGAPPNQSQKPSSAVAPPDQKDNGRPKTQLSVWREIEESLLGRALNRIDELNRKCPNPKLHAQLIFAVKECLGLLEAWKGSVA